jgi:uncharacterized peroxidase-related enzyme
MPHIELEKDVPGIRSLVLFRPESGQHLYALVQALLRGESPIPVADRELIAAYVSSLNECNFCMNSHAAAARCLYEDDDTIVDDLLRNKSSARLSPRLEALLKIAAKTRLSGSAVSTQDIAIARNAGADDREIHDTVLIAAVFCLFNRYVDGLASFTPSEPAVYEPMGQRMANYGYVFPKKQ